MIKIILLSIGLMYSNFSYAASLKCDALIERQMNFKQIVVTKKAFEYGKNYGLEYTLAAMAWKESSAGKHKYNPNDPSAGVFQVMIDNALIYSETKDTPENRILLAAEMIDNFYVTAEFSVTNIQFWQRLHGDDWTKVWASYNAGYNYQNGMSYAKDIAKKIKIIEQCGWP